MGGEAHLVLIIGLFDTFSLWLILGRVRRIMRGIDLSFELRPVASRRAMSMCPKEFWHLVWPLKVWK